MLVSVGAPASCAAPGLSDGPIVPRALRYVRQGYVDPERIAPREMLISAFESIQRSIPEILIAEHGTKSVSLTVGQATKKFHIGKVRNLRDLWSHMRGMFVFVEQHYTGETEARDIEYLAIDGIFASLDPHSALFHPKDYKEFMVGTKGDFGGVGVVISTRKSRLTVISPVDGTPAARAGLRANDRIVQINENSTINMPLNEAVDLIRGKIGTKVALRIEREGSSSFTVTLTRAQIEIDSVQSELTNHDGNWYGYVKVKSFQENTFTALREQIDALHAAADSKRGSKDRGLDGVIIDFRNNPGGLLYQSVLIADYFMEKGIIVSTVGSGREFIESHSANSLGTQPPYPLVALVNEGSASASEIVAGALQANGRAMVIGSRSYGKGSVQSVYDLQDGSGMKLTVAEYLAAGRQRVQEVGITPDIHLLPVTPDREQLNLVANNTLQESDLEKHFLNAAKEKRPESQYTLRYVKAAEPTPDDEDTLSSYSEELKLDEDFLVQFAQRVLSTGRLVPRKGTWPDLQDIVTAEQTTQNGKLAKQLTPLGINWTKGHTAHGPKIAFEYGLMQNGKTVSRVHANQEAKLVLRATNRGRHAVHQLIGQTGTKSGVLSNKEFIFGKLSPGQTKSWSTTFTPPAYSVRGEVPVTIDFQTSDAKSPKPYTAYVPLIALPRPQFAYRYRLESAPLSLGRSVTLVVDIRNDGTGPSQEAVASIQRVDGLIPFIETGRVTLGSIAPGKTATARFRFHVDPSTSETRIPLTLAIIDSETFDAITDDLTFTVDSADIEPAAKQWYGAPSFAINRASVPEHTTAKTVTLQGTVRDSSGLKDYYIYVGNKKVSYHALATEATESPLSASLPLEPGSNIITIAARDSDLLQSTHSFRIYRAEP